MQIVAQNLTYIYSEKSKGLAVRAIDGVTVTINEGDFFGIIGHTGSGKSTFVQHLNGLIKVGKDKGGLTVGEYDLSDKKCDFKGLRAKVGMVFQYPEHQLFAETVFDDVAFGLKNYGKDLSEEQISSAVRSALEIVGLDYDSVKGKSPFELSGGQKRRVAIAGVIVTKPEVLVLDEPVAGLDPRGKTEFIDLLHRLHKTFVKTIIIVSHDMNLVCENCNRIGVFSEGKLVKEGSPKEIFSSLDQIKELKLSLPVTAFLTEVLKEKGVNADNDFTEDGFVDAVVSAYMERKRGDK